MSATVETWVIPMAATTSPQEPEPLARPEAWCVVTDTDVLGPYASWEEAQSLLDEGVPGDVFPMTYR